MQRAAKHTWLICLLSACALALTVAYFLSPRHVPCNHPDFEATKQLKLEFSKKKPFCRPYYTLIVAYQGDEPAYVQSVGSSVTFQHEGGVSLRLPFRSDSYLMLPGDTYRSQIPLEGMHILFEYVLAEARPGHNGSVTYRIAAPKQDAKLEL